MENHRLSRIILFLAGHRERWAPKKQFKDCFKNPSVPIALIINDGPLKLRTVTLGVSSLTILSPRLKTPAGLLLRTKYAGEGIATQYPEQTFSYGCCDSCGCCGSYDHCDRACQSRIGPISHERTYSRRIPPLLNLHSQSQDMNKFGIFLLVSKAFLEYFFRIYFTCFIYSAIHLHHKYSYIYICIYILGSLDKFSRLFSYGLFYW